MSELGRDSMELLDAARAGDDPMPDDKARIRRRLMQLGVVGAVTTVASTTAAATAGTAGASVAPPALAASAALSVGAAAGTSTVATVGASAGLGLVAKLVVAVAIVGSVSAAGVKGVTVYRAHHPADSAVNVAEAPPVQAQVPLAAAEQPIPSTPTTATLAGSPLVGAPSDPLATASAKVPSAASPVVRSLNPLPTRPESTIEIETRLLRDAESVRRAGDGARALALLDEHAARFPNGVLAEERAAGRIFALCDLGRLSDATIEAQRFLAERPRSPLAARVRASCARLPAP